VSTLGTPRLEVPESRDPEKRAFSGLVAGLLVIILVVQVIGLFTARRGGGQGAGQAAAPGTQLDVEQIRDAALELERKNVSNEAAELWAQYLAIARLDGIEEGNIRYRIGKNRQNAGQPERAYAQFVIAEKLLGDSNPDLRDEIGRRRRECLRRMGQFADLAREVTERARPGSETGIQDVQVVAEIGSEKITAADFDRMLTEQIDLAVKSRPGITPEQEQADRERMHKQLADPQHRAESLASIIVTRVLAEEARKQELHEAPEFRERLTAVADGVLAQTLLHAEIAKRATVTEEDVRRFFEANRSRYEQPAASFIAQIVCADEAAARDVIARVQGGANFGDIAKSESLDKATRDQLGAIAEPVLEDGDLVPGLGRNAPLHEAIRDAEAGAVLAEPWKGPGGWHVIKILSHRTRLEPAFEEIRDEVRRDTAAARQREVTEQYIAELQRAYGVKLYPEALGAGPVGGGKEKPETAAAATSPAAP